MYLLTLFKCLEINDSIKEINYLLVIRENVLESVMNFVGTDCKKCANFSKRLSMDLICSKNIVFKIIQNRY